jgi:hypothetical protein
MGTTDTIRRIEKELGLSETSQVTTFEGIRETADVQRRQRRPRADPQARRAPGRGSDNRRRVQGQEDRPAQAATAFDPKTPTPAQVACDAASATCADRGPKIGGKHMPFRLGKSIKIAPGVRLSGSTSGVGVSGPGWRSLLPRSSAPRRSTRWSTRRSASPTTRPSGPTPYFLRLRDVAGTDYDLQGLRNHREHGGFVPYDLSVDGELQAPRTGLDPYLLGPGEEDPFFVQVVRVG